MTTGMPLSVVVGWNEVLNACHVGGIGGTLAAIRCVAGRRKSFWRFKMIGERVRAIFCQISKRRSIVGEERGLGATLAIELVKDRETKEPAAAEVNALVKYAYEKGLLLLLRCGAYENVIGMLVPLVIKDDQLEKRLSIMEGRLENVAR